MEKAFARFNCWIPRIGSSPYSQREKHTPQFGRMTSSHMAETVDDETTRSGQQDVASIRFSSRRIEASLIRWNDGVRRKSPSEKPPILTVG